MSERLTYIDRVRAQRCENGHSCACEFVGRDGTERDTVLLQMSSGCCVHGEKECTPPKPTEVGMLKSLWRVWTQRGGAS